MGHAAEKRHPATYADLEAVSPHLVAELVEGTLYTFPRPALPHANAATSLSGELHGPFQRGRGGPGGWWILFEPELRLSGDAAVPDVAGWRKERMPKLPDTPYVELAPDCICEVLSPSTERFDRVKKMPLYAREGVQHLWLLDPVDQTLEIFALGADRRWILLGVYDGTEPVGAPPFEAMEIDLTALWSEPG